MSGKELQIHVGDSLDSMGRRFVDAWHRAERGELTEANAERHLGFETFELFARVMTPRRLELLRHVHRHPPRSIRALSIALGRDYRRVHADVEALVTAGLLDRDAAGLHADYETVRMETRIAL
jgi:predicted transcriptional regulator